MTKYIILLLTFGAFVPLTIDAANVQAATEKPEVVAVSYKPADLRVKALKNVLEKYNSPLAPYSGVYINSEDKHGVDWKLLPAIAGLESSFGKRQLPGSHNSYGWGGGRIYFESVEDGVEKVHSGLRKRYMNRGASTVEQIAPIYSESATWAPRIRKFMGQIEAEYDKLTLETLPLSI